jgi:hypothetical protein
MNSLEGLAILGLTGRVKKLIGSRVLRFLPLSGCQEQGHD